MYLGVEIGGTKLQLGLGRGDGSLAGLWRGSVDGAGGGDGIRRQIVAAIPELLAGAGLTRGDLKGVGVGFGGPTDDATQRVIKSHHVTGWDGFPLADWLQNEVVGLPTVVCNDADVAGLAEALHGAGRGLNPVFYMTIGTGIGGGLVIDGEMYRGCGRGAVEIGHLRVLDGDILESYAAGWGIAARANRLAATDPRYTTLRRIVGRDLTGKDIAAAAQDRDPAACDALDVAVAALAEALQQMIKLLCPRRVVIGGGVSLMGDELLFDPLRRRVAAGAFPPFAGQTDIVPAALGEEVVVHGALALARQRFGG
jgi:glucokinase